MTRKDYKAFAEILRNTAAKSVGWEGQVSVRRAVCEEIAREMCTVFARDNERFDAGRFLEACNVQQ